MRRHATVVVISTMLMAGTASAQRGGRPAASPTPRVHGILEPLNFGHDVPFTDAFFTTVDDGWLTTGEGSKGGALVHTTDGGTTLTTVLGDPEGSERPFYGLRFLDRTLGFVAQKTQSDDDKLLRTIDGATWKVSGTLPQHNQDYRMVSATTGVVASRDRVLRTTDGGRTWTQVLDCKVRVQVQGATVNTYCEVWSFAFPSSTVGYALAGSLDAKGLYVFKTQDGGATWSNMVAQPGANDGREGHIAFRNEKSGFACLRDEAIVSTDDGGVTWDEVPGTTCDHRGPIIFADPEVAWSVNGNQLTWTANGGAKWTKQQIWPAYSLRAFSLPRRDRAYLAGDHGELYKYIIVPAEVAPKAIEAPVMPGFSTAIEDRATQLDSTVTGIETALAALPPDAATAAGGASGGNVAPAGSASAGGTDALAPFLDKCCGRGLSSLDLIFKAVGGLVPEYTDKYKNLNLVTLGLRIAGMLPDRTDSLRSAIKAFRSAKDRPGADQALANIKTALAGLRAAADTAVQKTP